jgi:small GTP-binding protein
MVQKKICLLGAFAVGKTSLVSRFIKSLYSDKYLTTVGVKVDKKMVAVNGEEVCLIVWDLAGEDEFQKVQMSYLRGSSGYLLVADGTRHSTIETARLLKDRATNALGQLPFILLINKSDLSHEWEVEDQTVSELQNNGWIIFKSSATSGEGVEEAFQALAELMHRK